MLLICSFLANIGLDSHLDNNKKKKNMPRKDYKKLIQKVIQTYTQYPSAPEKLLNSWV